MVKSVGPLTTNPKVPGLNHNPGPLCPSSKLNLFRPGESKGDEESHGKLPHNDVCQDKSGSHSWFPHARIEFGTHNFTLLVSLS